MTELETLYNRRQKAFDCITSGKEMPAQKVFIFKEICDRITCLESLKFLIATSPHSMDPKKVHAHWIVAKKLLKEIEPQPNEELQQLLNRGSEVFDRYKPDNIISYQSNLKKFINLFIPLWKNQNNFK